MTTAKDAAPKAAKKKRTTKKAPMKETPEPTAPAPGPGSPEKANVTSATLADAAKGYLAQLESEGRSNTTIAGYTAELRLAAKHLGDDVLLCELTPAKVQAFFESPKVNKTRSGRKKAMPGVLKTRRVLRQALVWAQENGMVEAAPIPADEA